VQSRRSYLAKVVVWSGGHDSTLVLQQLLSKVTVDNPIRALSMTHDQYDKIKTKCERKARSVILKKWGNNKHKLIHPYEINVTSTSMVYFNDYKIPGQPMFWLTGVFPYLRTGDEVYFGYISGDDFWHFKEEFCNAFFALCKFAGITATLNFPLEYWAKESVLRETDKLGLSKICWTCEDPPKSKKPCGKCHSCINIAKARLWMNKSKCKR
jgi:7-cyano-7-deazaguanine synthase in queuosine biosynthesis